MPTLIVNVYALPSPGGRFLAAVGFGAWHMAVMDDEAGIEYHFGPGGIAAVRGRADVSAGADACLPQGASYHSSIEMGAVESTALRELVAQLRRQDFAPGRYHVLDRNCNAFVETVCERLVGSKPPSWLNRAARWGSAVASAGDGAATAEPKLSKEEKRRQKEAQAAREREYRERPQLSEKQQQALQKIRKQQQG